MSDSERESNFNRDAMSSFDGRQSNDASFNQRAGGTGQSGPQSMGASGAQTGRSNISRNSGMPPSRFQSEKRQNQARNASRANKEVPEQKDDAQSQAMVKTVQTWQFYITGINILTVFLTVVFLEIMMLRNAVPMTNGILMYAGSSVSYFVVSLLTLLFLYANHEAVSYMVLDFWAYFSIFYGLCILTHGIVIIAVDSGPQKFITAQKIWDGLSQFEKEYFNEDSMELQNQRSKNTIDAGMFMCTIGVLILLLGALSVCLKLNKAKLDEENVKWNPDKEMKSRSIPENFHQSCKFSHNKTDKHYYPDQDPPRFKPIPKFSMDINLHEEKAKVHDEEAGEESNSGSGSSFAGDESLDYEIGDFNEDEEMQDQLKKEVFKNKKVNRKDDSESEQQDSDQDSDSDAPKKKKKSKKNKKKKGGKR